MGSAHAALATQPPTSPGTAPPLARVLHRHLLLRLMAALLIFGLLLGGWLAMDQKRAAARANQELAQALAIFAETYLDGAAVSLAFLSRLATRHDLKGLPLAMRELQQAQPFFERIVLLDERDIILAAAPSSGLGLAYPAFLAHAAPSLAGQAGASGKTLAMSRPVISLESGSLIVHMGHPLDGGKGLMVGEISLEALKSALDQRWRAGGASIILADLHGNLVVHPDDLLVRQQTNIGHWPLFQAAMARGGAGSFLFWEQGRPRLGVAQPLANTPWLCMVTRPLGDVLRPALTTAAVYLMGLTCLYLVSARLMGGALERRVLAPMARFARHIQALAGDLPRRPPHADPLAFLELMEIAARFDDLARHLLEREDALRASEGKHRALFENTLAGIYRLSPEGVILEANPAAARIFGYESREEFIATIRDVATQLYVDPRRRQEFLVLLERDGTVERFESAMRRKDGGHIWVELNARGEYDAEKRLQAIQGMVVDITPRVQATEALHTSHLYFKSVFNAVGDAIFVCDATGVLLDVNQRAEDLYGHAREELVGHPLGFMNQGGDSHGADEAWRWLEKARQGRPQTFEWRARRKNGELFWVEVSIRHASIGGEERFLVAVRDIAERKELEAQRLHVHQELERQVSERTLELRLANERLIELDQMKTAFLSSASHELRTPLTSILGFARLTIRLLRRHLEAQSRLSGQGGAMVIPAGKSQRILDNLSTIADEGERLSRLVNDLLDINTIESGRETWRDSLVAPAEVLHEVARLVRGMLLQQPDPPRFEVDAPADLPSLVIDRDKLVQVVLNLLHNAVKFSRQGLIRLEARPVKGGLEILVQDSGPGVPERDRGRIFEKFFQIAPENMLEAKPEGAGLGLAICRQIVEHYGGSIHVRDTPGGGATFVVFLPDRPPRRQCPFPASSADA